MTIERLAMRYYKEHRKAYIDFLNTQSIVNDIVDQYLLAFQRTQPHSPSYSGVQYSGVYNRTEEYIIEVEHGDLKRRAEDAAMLLDLKQKILSIKEAELRKSHDIYDAVYTAKWIDHKKPKDMIRDLDFKGFDYSEGHVYEIIKRISKEIEKQ